MLKTRSPRGGRAEMSSYHCEDDIVTFTRGDGDERGGAAYSDKSGTAAAAFPAGRSFPIFVVRIVK